MILPHISTKFDQNLGLKNMEFGIFEHNLQFDIIILTLLPSELQLEYAFYPWFSYRKQNLEVAKALSPGSSDFNVVFL